MKAIDIHSHLSTKKGYIFQTAEEVAAAEKHYRFKVEFKTDMQMVQDFRDADVKVILDGPLSKTLDQALDFHNYMGDLIKNYPDVIIGAWAYVKPQYGLKGLQELERCVKELKMTGLMVLGVEAGIPCNDKGFYIFYELCRDLDVPVLLLVGTTGLGAGLPGGGGYHLKYSHPMDVDDVAADFPDLKIIASHPAWPWQDEMIAVLLHKANVYNDLHGWSPKYFSPELKKEIGGRLQDKFVTGFDYPLFTYKRLFKDWGSEGYKPEVLEKVLYKNAQRILNI